MAMAYKCDRCGAFYESNTKTGKITTRRYDNAHAMREYDDLCEKCTWQLQRWFDMGKRGVNDDELCHGRWIPIEYDSYADGNPVYDAFECSVCGHEHNGDEDTLTAFCPDCGARMDGGDDIVLDQ